MAVKDDKLVFAQTHSGTNYPFPIDGDDYIPTIREEHLRIHRGQGFVCSDVKSLTNAQSMGFLLYNSADNPCHLRHYEITADGSPVTFTVYEVSSSNTITTTGTASPCVNANRLETTFQSSVALYIDSVVSSKGLQLEHSRTTGNKQAGGSKGALTTEWDLKSDHWYFFQVVNESGGATIMDYYYFWYEPRDD